MTEDPRTPSRYAITLDALESGTHVPTDQQHTVRPEPPHEGPVSQAEYERTEVLWVAGA